MKETLTSKKWQSMALGLAVTVFNEYQDAPWYMVVTVGVIVAAHLVGQGLADRGKGEMQVIIKAIADGVVKAEDIADRMGGRSSAPKPE